MALIFMTSLIFPDFPGCIEYPDGPDCPESTDRPILPCIPDFPNNPDALIHLFPTSLTALVIPDGRGRTYPELLGPRRF